MSNFDSTNARVILTGANGQLGKLVKQLKPEHVDLYAFTSSELDISDKQAVCRALDEIRPGLVINAAAYTQVDKAEEEVQKAFDVNSHGPENIADCLPATSRLIHISTDFVFDGTSIRPYQVTSPTNPLSIYGKSKLAGEQNVMKAVPDRSVIIRTAWVYSSDGSNFVNTMLRLMSEREELSVVSDQKGAPTSANSLAHVIWLMAARTGLHGIYHWTDQGETSWYEFATAIQALALDKGILKKRIPVHAISTAEYPTPATRPAYSVLDNTVTTDALGYEGLPWEEELNRILEEKITTRERQ